jgi:hypothetical protein
MHSLLVIGVVLVLSFAVYTVWRAKSMFLGFTWLAFYYVFSSTLLGFSHAVATGAGLSWFSFYHQRVAEYSVVGCFSMLFGILLATGSKGRTFDILKGDIYWLNVRMGLLLYSIGLSATLLLVFFREVPTFSTALSQLGSFKNVGMLVFVADGMKRNSWSATGWVGALHLLVSVASSLASGHSPFDVNLLFPVVCVLAGARGITIRSLAIFCFAVSTFFLLFAGWMDNRQLIRSGELEKTSFSKASGKLASGFFQSLTDMDLDADSANQRIRERIDMTETLAMQVSFQPEMEPYAHGATFLDAGLALIPRIIWPSKPVIAGGSEFVSRFTGMVRSTEDKTSLGVPYPFELYANGGPVLVVVGLFVLGWLIVRLEIHCIFASTSLANRLSFFSILVTLGSGGQRMDVVVPSLLAGFLTSWVLGHLLERFFPCFSASVQGLPTLSS